MNQGFVYVLRTKDIELPVCKIGMTSRDPWARCLELNNSSSGDLIWEVFDSVHVSDCRELERAIHKHLQAYRQRGRELFGLPASDGFKALQHVLANTENIRKLVTPDLEMKPIPKARPARKFAMQDKRYADLLLTFAELTGTKGRPFGQLNRPHFGMSDGKEGLQWNLAIHAHNEEVTLGVNLEGMKYQNWPIATFILSELKNSHLKNIKEMTGEINSVHVRLMRDAWQAASRPKIVEQYIGGEIISLDQLSEQRWHSMLIEALACLDEERGYRGRAQQEVTLPANKSRPLRKAVYPVSPHLTVFTPISLEGDLRERLSNGMELLRPVYEWVQTQSSEG